MSYFNIRSILHDKAIQILNLNINFMLLDYNFFMVFTF